VGDAGKRQVGREEHRCCIEEVSVPCGPSAMAPDTVAGEVFGESRAVYAEVGDELADGGAFLVGRNQAFDGSQADRIALECGLGSSRGSLIREVVDEAELVAEGSGMTAQSMTGLLSG